MIPSVVFVSSVAAGYWPSSHSSQITTIHRMCVGLGKGCVLSPSPFLFIVHLNWVE